MPASADPSFLAHFAALNDPRQAGKVLYPLAEILLLLLCATIAGADDFVEIALWGNEHLDFLRRFCPYRHGIPSHDVLCDVIAALDPETFKACFLDWVETLRAKDPTIIAVDGKTSRRSHACRKGRLPLHMVSAWATGQRLVLGQEAVPAKANEIVAIPALLQRLDLQGALVTIDAMGSQTAIAQTILDGGGDYVPAFKENWPATYAQVEAMFAAPPGGLSIQRSQTVDGEHGRIETRRHAICREVDWLFADRRYPGAFRFPGLAALGMVESETERNGRNVTIFAQHRSTSTASPTWSAATGGSRIGCIGCSMSSSVTTSPACVLVMVRPTWPSTSTPLSTC
jgi:hypothetical protein